MATSGVSVYSTNILTIYEDALRLLKVLGQGESASSAMKTDDLSLVETYFKGLSVHDLTLWKTETESTTLVASQANYAYGNGSSLNTALPIKLTDAYFRDDTDSSNPIDIPLKRLTREEYMSLSNKLTEGEPSQYYYEKTMDTGTVYLYPVPDSSTAGLKLYMKYITYLDNVTSIATNEIDIPAEWLEAVTYGLAVRLSRPYGMALQERMDLRKEYKELLQLALDHDVEEGSVFFQPEQRWQ